MPTKSDKLIGTATQHVSLIMLDYEANLKNRKITHKQSIINKSQDEILELNKVFELNTTIKYKESLDKVEDIQVMLVKDLAREPENRIGKRGEVTKNYFMELTGIVNRAKEEIERIGDNEFLLKKATVRTQHTIQNLTVNFCDQLFQMSVNY